MMCSSSRPGRISALVQKVKRHLSTKVSVSSTTNVNDGFSEQYYKRKRVAKVVQTRREAALTDANSDRLPVQASHTRSSGYHEHTRRLQGNRLFTNAQYQPLHMTTDDGTQSTLYWHSATQRIHTSTRPRNNPHCIKQRRTLNCVPSVSLKASGTWPEYTPSISTSSVLSILSTAWCRARVLRGTNFLVRSTPGSLPLAFASVGESLLRVLLAPQIA
jgi:hypothetical protein